MDTAAEKGVNEQSVTVIVNGQQQAIETAGSQAIPVTRPQQPLTKISEPLSEDIVKPGLGTVKPGLGTNTSETIPTETGNAANSCPPSETITVVPEKYEEQHVHQVYEQIASHFSSTRYKPWPIVESFLQSLLPGSIGLDIGCGNGKYLAVNKDIFIIGSDRSSNLVKIATQHEPHSAVVADSLSLPHQNARFDFAICIAVVHHLSTPERRREAVKCILDPLKDGGKALVYVWALEQGASRRGWDVGHEQDVMVPWVLKRGKKKAAGAEPEQTFQRYYHLYRKGELEDDIASVGGEVVEAGYEKDNWWAICQKGV